MISYIGKTLLLEEDNERVLVIGDLHIGYDESLRRSGVMLPNVTLNETEQDLIKVLDKTGKVSKVVLLGDVKHSFGILGLEWKGILGLFDFIRSHCDELVIIKGNHDASMKFIAEKRGLFVKDFFIWKKYAFLHGDKDLKDIYSEDVKCWVVGHAHPAVWLRDGPKREKYKCFLVGSYKRKKVIVMPSFFSGNEGSDPRENDLGLAWDFNLMKFDVVVIGGSLETLEFGKLNKISY